MSLFFNIFILCLTPCTVIGGIIKGQVTDSITGIPLTGATIRLENTSLYDIAGLDGSYEIQYIPAGSYTLVISYVSYTSFKRRIEVKQSRTTIIKVKLRLHEENKLKEITIRAKRNYSNNISARSAERNAVQLINIVSGHAIRISPDQTVANVVKHISGVSIDRNGDNGGQYAIIRGMDKRYNYIMINGVKIPSPDNAYRYVPLDIFPSSLLSRLEVYKTLTPDMEGDAVGGVVNMVMKDAPDKLSGSAHFAIGYNQIFFNRDMMTFDVNDINKKSPYELYGNQYNASRQDFSKAAMDYSIRRPLPDLSGGFSISNRFLQNRLGVVIAGAVQNTSHGNNSLFFDSEVVDTLRGVTLTDMKKRKYADHQLHYGAYAQIDYHINENNQLKWYNTIMNLTNIQVRDSKTTLLTIGGYDPANGNASLEYATRSRLTDQQIFNSVMQGKHILMNKFILEWSAVYSIATRKQPDNTTALLKGTERNFKDKRTTVREASRRWDHNSDQDLAAYLNITYDQMVGGTPVKLKAGGLFRSKHRNNFYNEYYFRPSDPFAEYSKDFNDYTQVSWTVENPRGSVASPLNYNASERTLDGYLQFNIKGKQFEATGGVRLENIHQRYKMRFPIGEGEPTKSKIYTDVLPSVHFRYITGEKSDFRISYFRSVNKPGYFEIVPYTIINEDYVEIGNPDLQEAIADNIGICYEYFPNPAGQLRADVFYKHIRNPIEYTLQADSIRGQDIYYTPGNFGNAINFGGELSYMEYFNKIGIKINYTYTHSRITTLKSKRIRNKEGNIETIKVNETRPLCGQSAHIANFSLLYKDVRTGWDAQLTANYTGKRINTVSQFIDNDLWQKGMIQMDVSIEKKLKNGITLFCKANNLLNSPMLLYVNNFSSKNIGKPHQDINSGITLIRQDHYLQTYRLGARYTW